LRRTVAFAAGLLLLCGFAAAGDPDPEDVTPTSESAKTYEAYLRTLLVAVVDKRQVDLNGDGLPDVLVFSSGGEETMLDLLVSGANGFVVWHMPVAQAYEVLEEATRVVVRLRFDTYPAFGSMWGGDLHGWYDHYAVVDGTVELRNGGREAFYRAQRHLYQERIAQLSELLSRVEAECQADNTCIWTKKSRYAAQQDRYRKFIHKADELLKGPGRRTSAWS
jgi:hypothetical protein